MQFSVGDSVSLLREPDAGYTLRVLLCGKADATAQHSTSVT